MEKGKSQSKANKGMHRFISGLSFAVDAPILSTLVFNHRNKKKKSTAKESTEGASAPSFISPILTREGSDQYDVFLSFRGLDTRKGFTDYLYHSLVNAGIVPICVFRDDNNIPIGEEIGSQLLNAIKQSKISVPIIFENYASSKWCLRELIHIMDCKKNTSHIVLPIFYKVNPSDVRYLKGSFGKAYHLHKKVFDENDVQEGQRALREVTFLKGWESEKIANGCEGELVEKVIKTILSKLRHDFQLDVTKHLVGIGDHVNKIRNWVDTPTNVAQMIGIYGMGGIGKTTLAKFIYNKLSNDFLHHSFLLDIRETVHRNDIPYLQNQLIKEIQPNEQQVCKVDDGISLIKSRIKEKRVLILLDDIDHNDQLNALARNCNWFSSGSIIIVATRNKAVLDQSEFGAAKYELIGLDKKDSLLLFNRHAFRMNHSLRDFEDISHDIISTMGGLPLALEVIGSYLYGKTDRNVWVDVLKQLTEQPYRDVQKTLKISYDALDDRHKEIFLDIACFFIGKESKFAMYMWDDCGFYASQGIEELKPRCLIKVGDDGKSWMHDQLRDLGRSISCQGQPPEKHSRLWVCKAASKVLMEKKGTKRIQAICLDDGPLDNLQAYTNEQFENLQSLRFLQLRRAAISGDFNNLFSELRWLHWFDVERCISFSPTNLHLPKLVVLQLSGSAITEHWLGWSSIMVAKRLKVVELAFCYNLKCTPDLSTFTELEILILKHCYGLEQIHSSIGKVKSLISLDLGYCVRLKELPEEVGELEELKEVILDFAGIIKIPTSIGSLRKLEKLSAYGCRSLREIPSSIGDLQNLQHLDISYSAIEKLPSAIGRLKKLRRLCLELCLNLIGEIPSEIGELSSLEILEITSTPIFDLPESIRNLSSLQHLSLWGCYELLSLPELPSCLTYLSLSCQDPRLPQLEGFKYLKELSIQKCSSIVRLILPELQCSKKLMANSCDNLVEVRGLDKTPFLEVLGLSNCASIERLPDPLCFATLKELNINGCCNLRGIESLERFLSCRSIYITGRKSLEKLPNLSKFEMLENFTMRYLLGVTEIPGIEESRSLTHIDITGCASIKTLPDLSGCEKLQFLVVQDCKKLTQLRELEKLHLIYLDISGCGSLEKIPDVPGMRVIRNYQGAQYEVRNRKIVLR
ncbi:disease resistance protein L6-like [Rhodamnia argentea]|uniref:Disease resistance protein L6-like n=1 Tax=Rhodamnia argentea TaxID=178133 RepID=A0ABM3HJ81_9MYRT|nr:disease resistance protein L6-like [Rhodamnia argentea]